MPKLSILICTISRRVHLLNRLLKNLQAQERFSEVEILIEYGDTESTGTKRNKLLLRASSPYIAFVDDDDLVAPNYIPLVLDAIKTEPDVVDMNLIMTTDGTRAERSFHHLSISNWSQVKDPIVMGRNVYFRYPNHLNPVKTLLARQVGFKDITEGEDRIYSDGLKNLLRTSSIIEQPIYYYLHTTTPL